LKVEKALAGFLQYKSAEGLAPVTVSGYERDLKLWIDHMGDIDVIKITPQHILSFLNYMRTDYVPRRIAGDNSIKLAPKTVYNIYVSLAFFLTWASGEFNYSNPMKNVPRPRVPEDAPVQPFKKEEIELLIKACDFSQEAVTDRRHKFIMQRSTGKRDKAILLTLLDTGLRASELCALRIADVDMKTGKIVMRSREAGRPKAARGGLYISEDLQGDSSGVTWLNAKMQMIQILHCFSESSIGHLIGTRGLYAYQYPGPQQTDQFLFVYGFQFLPIFPARCAGLEIR